MTWLSKVGTVLAKIVGFISGLTPLIGNTFGGQAAAVTTQVGTSLDQALGVIQVAEAMFAATGAAKTGPQKLQAATPFISKLLLATETLAHAKIQDAAKFNAAAEGITSALADLLNSLDPNSLQTHTSGS